MTRKISVADKQISIELTNHFRKRMTERKISFNNLTLNDNILTNILSSKHKKHIIKNLLHNISIVIKKDSPVRLAFITVFSGLECNSDNANIITFN
jgi:hypothetical protein